MDLIFVKFDLKTKILMFAGLDFLAFSYSFNLLIKWSLPIRLKNVIVIIMVTLHDEIVCLTHAALF